MTQRYKVKTPDRQVYHEVLTLLETKVRIYVASEKRLMISTDEIPDDLGEQILAKKAIIVPDFQYHAE